MQTTEYHLNGQPVTIIARENRSEDSVETAEGRVLRVFKAGLSPIESTGTVALSDLRVDPKRSNGAR
jgi:hypothetical protein